MLIDLKCAICGTTEGRVMDSPLGVKVNGKIAKVCVDKYRCKMRLAGMTNDQVLGSFDRTIRNPIS